MEHILQKNLAANLTPIDIELGEIFCDNDFNCRGKIPPIDVIPLAQSIDKIGLQQPIMVQPWAHLPGKKYRIISGHRRFMAFTILQRATIPGIITGHMDELDARKLNLEENLKRKDLNILQEAKALEPFSFGGWTQQQIAQEFSQPTPWVQIRLSLLKLPSDIQEKAAAGFFTQDQVRQLSTLKSTENQYAAAKKIIEAKQKGETKKIEIVKKKIKPLTKRKRETSEILKLMDVIQKHVGNSFATRALAWAAGEITEFELQKDLVAFCAEQGVEYRIPAELLEAATALA